MLSSNGTDGQDMYNSNGLMQTMELIWLPFLLSSIVLYSVCSFAIKQLQSPPSSCPSSKQQHAEQDKKVSKSDTQREINASLVEEESENIQERCNKGAYTKIKHKNEKVVSSSSIECCEFRHGVLPPPPDLWPQRPLLLRPTPNTSTRVRSVRYASQTNHNTHKSLLPEPGYCMSCNLPINNGTEEQGKTLVVDFETNLFVGTAMLRIRDTKPLPLGGCSSGNKDYFEGKKRTFQAVVRGKFLAPGIPMSECITGQVFNKPAGSLPPRIVLTGAVKIISHLAPQLQAEFHSDSPRFLSPLVSTAQTAIVSASSSSSSPNVVSTANCQGTDDSIETTFAEPPTSSSKSFLQALSDASDYDKSPEAHASRAKARKKAFDKSYAKKNKEPTFDTCKEYTFEFYQHLLDFNADTLSIDFGRPVGKIGLAKMLNGQPIKFMAAHQKVDKGKKSNNCDEMDWLWSFDIWHESLYGIAADAQ